MTAVTVTVGYSDSFGNPRFITSKPPLLTVTKKLVAVTPDSFIKQAFIRFLKVLYKYRLRKSFFWKILQL